MQHLPFTLARDNEPDYNIMRRFITGGLSNVFNRLNIAGQTKITKLYYENLEIKARKTDHVVTNICGLDANSLYPSSFSSQPHKFIPYSGGRMLMPGKIVDSYKCDTKETKDQALDLIKNGRDRTDYVFIASVKGKIPTDKINYCVNFPPIIRNIDMVTDEATLGPYMYRYLVNTNLSHDTKERKLTNLLSTHGEYMAFNNYYLHFLIDEFGFIIEDIDYFIMFDAHSSFNGFVNHFMNKRIEFMNQKNGGGELFCKLILNGSYGYDIMNEEHFTEISFKDGKGCVTSHMLNTYRSERKLSDDLYQVNLAKKEIKL